MGKKVVELMYQSGDAPAKIIKEQGMGQISNTGELEGILIAVLLA